MIHITDRNDLITWLVNNIQNPIVKRALQTGTIEVLGKFKEIPPFASPGWIVKIESKYHKIYYAGILRTQFTMGICYVTSERIFWKYWIGDKCNTPLNQGDNPKLYKELRDDNRDTIS